MKQLEVITVILQVLVMTTSGGFIVGQEREFTCGGSLTVTQKGAVELKLVKSIKSLKLFRDTPTVLRVEGSCCWTVHARKKYKGFKTFLLNQGEFKISSKLVRSISKTDCETMPSLYMASCGGIFIMIISSVLLSKYQKRVKCKDDMKDFENRDEMLINDDVGTAKSSIESTLKIKDRSSN